MNVRVLLVYGVVVRLVVAFSFRSKSDKENVMTGPRHDLNLSPYEMLQSTSRPSDIYAAALSELQDLESQPLCHRVAARLLVGNCQLLDGKDEATILTDSGRRIRDFVDAYSASMAICDLERGRFTIPSTCDKFREPQLIQMPLDQQARLHVTSREIDSCLSGLGQEPSAWSTWISYRHKALMFCEAARADQEKAQNILLYQRLTKVMAKLTYGVEIELQKHMEDLELLVRRAGGVIQDLDPELDRLRDKLAIIEEQVTQNFENSLKRSGDSISNGMQGAANLQRMLAVMIQTVLDGTSHVAAAQAKSVEVADQRVENANTWAAIMATAAASAATLTNQIELSRLEVEALSLRQLTLSTNLDNLVTTTDSLSSKYEDHASAIDKARNMTNEILETLEVVAGSAAIIENASRSQWRGFNLSTLLPYLISPVATLILGSYGLAPSVVRNLGLVALGEVIGFSVSHIDRVTMPWKTIPLDSMMDNATAVG